MFNSIKCIEIIDFDFPLSLRLKSQVKWATWKKPSFIGTLKSHKTGRHNTAFYHSDCLLDRNLFRS